MSNRARNPSSRSRTTPRKKLPPSHDDQGRRQPAAGGVRQDQPRRPDHRVRRRRFARKRTRSETPNNLTSSVDPNARRSGLIEGTHKIRLSPSDTVRAAKQKISVRRSRVRVRSRSRPWHVGERRPYDWRSRVQSLWCVCLCSSGLNVFCCSWPCCSFIWHQCRR